MVEGGILARPPLNLLIDPNAAKRKSPWEIHISELLDMFLEAILKSEFLDLRAAGTAALTSATIYRFKVESLFLFEKLQRERRIMDAVEPPQIVVMPFRYEVYSTTVDELFDALDQDPRGDSPQRQGGEHGLALPPRGGRLPRTRRTTSSRSSRTSRRSSECSGSASAPWAGSSSPTSSRGCRSIEAARTFILLLFAASNGTVVLDQEGEDDLQVILVG